MPLVIFDGPEAAGKSTLIDALMLEWGTESRLRSWGPKKSWLQYCQSLFEDLEDCEENEQLLVVWSRSWCSRAVYNKLLSQGQSVPPEVTKELENIVVRSGGLLYLVTSPVSVLLERRIARIERGDEKADHQLDVHKELHEFQFYVRARKWSTLPGNSDVDQIVRTIIHALVQRNPECRMNDRKEKPIELIERGLSFGRSV